MFVHARRRPAWRPTGSGWAPIRPWPRARSASGLRSMITASRSVPDTPSTMAWCVFDSMAQRPSSRPSTTQISHSGLERSSCWAMTRPDQLAQLGLAAGGGQGRVAHVVLDVEVRVVHPDRAAQLEGDELHHLAVARHQGELGVDHGDDVGEGRRRALEDGDRGDVHVADVVLDVEERRVQRAQPVSAHRPSLPRGRDARQDGSTGPADFSWYPRGQPADGGRRRSSPSPARKGVAEHPLARLLVGRLDHPGRPVLGHGPQPHGSAGLAARLQADHGGPAASRRAISRSMRRCTVRRRSPSAPLALPCAADMDDTMTTRSSPSPRSTSALVTECTPPSM